MTADPLSEVLKLASVESILTGSFTAGGAWALRFPVPDKIKFFVIVKGWCWLRVDGVKAPVRLEGGDVILLSARRAFVLAADLTAKPLDAVEVFKGRAHETVRLGEGEECVQIGGHVRLDPTNGRLLEEALPPLLHVRAGSPEAAAVRWSLEQLSRERASEQPGSELASAHLAHMLLVHVLRVHLQRSGPLPSGWLRAVADPQLAPAIQLMHGHPGRPWQLGELARAAAMSRSSFAHRFKAVAGVAPLSYLTAWRMRLAERALRDESTSISALAQSLGYASDSAFSNAFKRVTGMAPKRYRSAARARA